MRLLRPLPIPLRPAGPSATGRAARPRRRRGRAVLLWAAAGFVLAQAAFFAPW